MRTLLLLLAGLTGLHAQQYDLLLRGGHVIDPKNNINAVRDVAIKDKKIAAVEAKIDPSQAKKVVDASGLYVTPGLIDIHVHVYTGTGEKASYAGDNSLYPDTFAIRTGVTTVVDAGSAGSANFEDFRQRIIDRAKTRVLAFLNIVGAGMRGGVYENNLEDMKPEVAAAMAQKHKDVIVGIKTAHYAGPEWTAVDNAVAAGKAANIPVMVDFGANRLERPLRELLTTHLRPGDIYTHCFSGLRGELTRDGKVNPGMLAGRTRGVIFDVGHGNGSFAWRVVMPLMKAGFTPDSISTDIHVASLNAGMKDMLNVMSKFLNIGMPLAEVVKKSTWNPAQEIRRTDLGNLSVGAPADVTVLSVNKGRYGFVDSFGGRLTGNQSLAAELTVRDGTILYDLNGISKDDWQKLNPAQIRLSESK